ncbi:MAG TPA: glycoside hydrolase family 9 protein [Cyclobacteriaceae bacterium]|nr:glycoside hydrolase family 9 protein [Cyclobacteriaceae bacterium]
MRFGLLLMLLMPWLSQGQSTQAVIRINLVGYSLQSPKVAVWGSLKEQKISQFQVIDTKTKKTAYAGIAGQPFGSYGPFRQSYRLDFSALQKPGIYYIEAAGVRSPEFSIGEKVYDGMASFCLRYIRQQRSGFNPFLKDSCHTDDGYALYGHSDGIPDSTHIDAVGGWHDASDYLQYVTTSATTAYHLLMAWRDFPGAFQDNHLASGLAGSNGTSDVLDEARWGLNWLLKMHPKPDVMFNQLGDDRDHMGMRIPGMDNQYGKGYERPVYFIDGLPQQRGKFMNKTTGTSSSAAKMAAAFALGHQLFKFYDPDFAWNLRAHAVSAEAFSLRKPGVTQTVSVRSPYIYNEENWVDDMELAQAAMVGLEQGAKRLNRLKRSMHYARKEPVSPWLTSDTAAHYQWYPFVNIGHYELAKEMKGSSRDSLLAFYRQGIEAVMGRAKSNAFYRGIPYIWCSNNLTAAFAIQCYWYRQLSKDESFIQLEQANVDWLLGCNPWGTSMVFGLPSHGDTPTDPHSAFTHLKNYPIDGGLVDGPVYTSIYKSLIGITLYQQDEYAPFQSDLAVYHDDYGDYSTNEPTLDGTALLIYLLAAQEQQARSTFNRITMRGLLDPWGAIVRGDTTQRKLAIVFTGDSFADGSSSIIKALKDHNARATFFLTGNFYKRPEFRQVIHSLKAGRHQLGPHSDKHLLYADWSRRDSVLVTREQFQDDLAGNLTAMKGYGLAPGDFFLPSFEWYNGLISAWTHDSGMQLINYTAGTLSHADYTGESDHNFRSSQEILNSVYAYESGHESGLNGFILLMHIGAGPGRKDKLYDRLPELLSYLRSKGYDLVTVDQLLKP